MIDDMCSEGKFIKDKEKINMSTSAYYYTLVYQRSDGTVLSQRIDEASDFVDERAIKIHNVIPSVGDRNVVVRAIVVSMAVNGSSYCWSSCSDTEEAMPLSAKSCFGGRPIKVKGLRATIETFHHVIKFYDHSGSVLHEINIGENKSYIGYLDQRIVSVSVKFKKSNFIRDVKYDSKFLMRVIDVDAALYNRDGTVVEIFKVLDHSDDYDGDTMSGDIDRVCRGHDSKLRFEIINIDADTRDQLEARLKSCSERYVEPSTIDDSPPSPSILEDFIRQLSPTTTTTPPSSPEPVLTMRSVEDRPRDPKMWTRPELLDYLRKEIPYAFAENNRNPKVHVTDWNLVTTESLVERVSRYLKANKIRDAFHRVIDQPLIDVHRNAERGVQEDPSGWTLHKLRSYIRVNDPTFVGRTTMNREMLIQKVKHMMMCARKKYRHENSIKM